MVKREAPFNQGTLESLAKVLGHTNDGLTGTEIEHTLRTCRIPDVDPLNTKWKRLFNALAVEQTQKQWGNHIIGFIHYAMKPVRWSDNREQFEWLRDELNKVLVFSAWNLVTTGTFVESRR